MALEFLDGAHLLRKETISTCCKTDLAGMLIMRALIWERVRVLSVLAATIQGFG